MKREIRLLRRAVVPTLLLGILIPAGCGDDEETPPGPEPYGKNEPRYVLANVALAFNAGDVKLLGDCLGRDFVFYFDVNDVGQKVDGYKIPASWTREEFLTAFANLCQRTHDVSLDNSWEKVGSPDPGETSYFAAAVPLAIAVMIDRNNGYAFDDGACDYEFTENSGQEWRLVRWWDRSRECGCIGPVTFGLILARYHP